MINGDIIETCGICDIKFKKLVNENITIRIFKISLYRKRVQQMTILEEIYVYWRI